MRVSDLRNVLEAPLTRSITVTAAKPSRAVNDVSDLPVAINGIISRPNEIDEFRLRPQKGQGYLVRVYARTLGTPLDPIIEIVPEGAEAPELVGDDVANYDERGTPGVPNAFRRLSIMDPSLVWHPKVEGPYLLRIKDIRNQGTPTCVYRVEITPLENRIDTYLITRNYSRESPRDSGLAIPQGNRWTLQLGLSAREPVSRRTGTLCRRFAAGSHDDRSDGKADRGCVPYDRADAVRRPTRCSASCRAGANSCATKAGRSRVSFTCHPSHSLCRRPLRAELELVGR